MTNIYYTAHTGRRNANGHTRTTGTVYAIRRGDNTTPHGVDALENIGEYTHQSGGAGVELAILTVCDRAGVDIGGGYYGQPNAPRWWECVNLIEL